MRCTLGDLTERIQQISTSLRRAVIRRFGRYSAKTAAFSTQHSALSIQQHSAKSTAKGNSNGGGDRGTSHVIRVVFCFFVVA
jgi:hypothetical protein